MRRFQTIAGTKAGRWPAFPSCQQYFPEDTNYTEHTGIDYRTYLLAEVLKGLLSNPSLVEGDTAEEDVMKMAMNMVDLALTEVARAEQEAKDND